MKTLCNNSRKMSEKEKWSIEMSQRGIMNIFLSSLINCVKSLKKC